MLPLLSTRRLQFTLIALLLLVVAVLAWSQLGGLGSAPLAQPAPPVPVTLTTVVRADVENAQTGVGAVQAHASVTLHSRIDGQLQRVAFKEGQDVRAGQLLAQLDDRALQAQLEQAQAQQARDQALLANARVDLQRYLQLARDGSVAQQTVDTQRAQVAQDEAALLNDRAAVDYARVQLSYATITAPLSGRVGARLVDPGNIVHAADPGGLLVINQVDPIDVVFSLTGDLIGAINAAQQDGRGLGLKVYARDGSLLGSGQLVLVNNQIDTSSGSIQLKGSLANPKHLLWPGQYVSVRLVLGIDRGVLTLPEAAILRGPDGTYVYRVGADHRAQPQLVQLGRVQDGRAVIASGLQAGDSVVLDGQYKIKPGSIVTVAARSAGQ